MPLYYTTTLLYCYTAILLYYYTLLLYYSTLLDYSTTLLLYYSTAMLIYSRADPTCRSRGLARWAGKGIAMGSARKGSARACKWVAAQVE